MKKFFCKKNSNMPYGFQAKVAARGCHVQSGKRVNVDMKF